MKKLLSILLCAVMLLVPLSPGASAMSMKEGLAKLQTQFKSGKGSELDYVYYSPVKGNSDKTKYPLIVWLHGQFSGNTPGHQGKASEIAYWTSDEMQSRILKTKGAFLLLPRDPTLQLDFAWSLETSKVKTTIDEFISKNKNSIDTSRIYLGGYSMGGKGTWRVAADYPDFFAAIFPMSPVYAPSDAQAKALRNTPMWLITCKNDNYFALLPEAINGTWNKFRSYATDLSKLRWSIFDELYEPDGTKITFIFYMNHNTWDAATYDLFMKDNSSYKSMTTINGRGKTVNLVYPYGLLYWLSSHSKEQKPNDSDDSGNIFDKIEGLDSFHQVLTLFMRMISIITKNNK